jgi:hypothetical protein
MKKVVDGEFRVVGDIAIVIGIFYIPLSLDKEAVLFEQYSFLLAIFGFNQQPESVQFADWVVFAVRGGVVVDVRQFCGEDFYVRTFDAVQFQRVEFVAVAVVLCCTRLLKASRSFFMRAVISLLPSTVRRISSCLRSETALF